LHSGGTSKSWSTIRIVDRTIARNICKASRVTRVRSTCCLTCLFAAEGENLLDVIAGPLTGTDDCLDVAAQQALSGRENVARHRDERIGYEPDGRHSDIMHSADRGAENTAALGLASDIEEAQRAEPRHKYGGDERNCGQLGIIGNGQARLECQLGNKMRGPHASAKDARCGAHRSEVPRPAASRARTRRFIAVISRPIGKETNKPIQSGLLRIQGNLMNARTRRGEFCCLDRKAGLDHFAQQLHRGQHPFLRDQATAVELGQNAAQADFLL
jgi:hypothetical protein